MMESLRLVTKNTMFDQWLGAVRAGSKPGVGSDAQVGLSVAAAGPDGTTTGAAAVAAAGGLLPDGVLPGGVVMGAGMGADLKPLLDVAEYLAASGAGAGATPRPGTPVAAAVTAAGGLGMAGVAAGSGTPLVSPRAVRRDSAAVTAALSIGGVSGGVTAGAGAAAGGTVAAAASAATGAAAGTPAPGGYDATTFRPGWEDIFRMNQKQLEAAIHRVSNDANLEPERKAYLIQYIMVRPALGRERV